MVMGLQGSILSIQGGSEIWKYVSHSQLPAPVELKRSIVHSEMGSVKNGMFVKRG